MADDEGGSVIWSEGGIREVKYNNSDYQVIETGQPVFGGGYNRPVDGRRTYLAARKARGSKYGSFILRIYGQLSLNQANPRYNPPAGNQYHWMSRRILKGEAERLLWDLRLGGGGDGTGEPAYLNYDGDQGDFANTYLHSMSEVSGWNWDSIETVQFMSEPIEPEG